MPDLNKLMIQLGKMKIDSVLLEGGGSLAWSMLAEGYVDEINAFIAPKMFGGTEAPTPVGGPGIEEVDYAAHFKLKDMESLDGDIFATYVRSGVTK